MKSVVVLSGGQDSALCLALALKRHGAGEVAAITFEYGQRHAVETGYARRLLKSIPAALCRSGTIGRLERAIPHKVVHLGFYREITSNALMTPGARIRKGSGCPNTVVEGRNAVFLQLAAVWAKTLGADEIWTGVSQTDYSGYPDCRAPFIRAEEKAIRLALDCPMKIVTPFMRRTKAEEWALADRLGLLELIRRETVTCYDGIPGDGCGKCPACRLRRGGLKAYLEGKKQKAGNKK